MYSPFLHPDKVIARGSIILTSLLVLTAGTAYAAVDTAVRSGEVQNYVIEPSIKAYNSFVEDFANQLVEDQKAKTTQYHYESPDSATTTQNNVQINISNTSTGSGTTTTTTQKKIVVTPKPTATTYPSSLNTNWQEDAAARQAQQKAEYDAAVKKMDEDYAAKTKAMDDQYNANIQKAQQDQEDWANQQKSQMGF